MKNLYSTVILIALLLITVCYSAEAKSPKKTATFNVMMDSHSSKDDIEKKLKKEDGILNFKIEYKQNSVIVTYDDKKTNVARIMKAFKEIGYLACPVGENCSNKKGGCLNNPAIEVNTMK